MMQRKTPNIGMDQVLDSDFDNFALSPRGHTSEGESVPDIPTVDDDSTLHISAQQQLWLAVVKKAVADATAPEVPDDELEDLHKRTARAVIFSRNSVTAGYFNEVCNLAGVDPEVIRLRVTKMIREGIHINDEDE